MSILDKLKSFEHTFTAWVSKMYAKLYAAEPKIETVADSVFKYAIPALQILIGMEAGQPAAALVGQVATEAQNDLHAVSSLIYDFGPNPTVAGVINGVNANLDGLLAAGHVKSAGSVAVVQKVTNSLGALAAAMIPEQPAPEPAAVVAGA